MSGEGFKARDRLVSEWFSLIRSGTLRLPRFQRHEAWDRGTVVSLLETVLRELPAGATLVLSVGEPEPFVSRHLVTAPEVNGPVHEHLLDGQQRLTALWRSLHGTYSDLSLFVAWRDDPDHPGEQVVVESQPRWERKGTRYPVWCDDPRQVFGRDLIPVTLVAPDAFDRASTWLQQATDDKDQVIEWMNRLSALRQQIASYNIPYLSLPQATPRDVALDVFIKMNTSNIRLTPFDIVVAQVEAAAGSSMHELLEEIRSAVPHADAYGDLGTLLLDASCLLAGRVSSKANYLRLDPKMLSDQWQGLVEPLKFTVALLEGEGVFDEARLPSGTVLPVVAALACNLPDSGDALGNARTLLRYYLWRAFLTRRYESSTGSRAFQDYQALRAAIADVRPLDQVTAPIFDEAAYPIPGVEQLLTARWPKTRDILARGILALMLKEGARDLADDAPATRQSIPNREYHHLFPDSTLVKRAGIAEDESYRALNCALITWQTNRKVSNLSPLQYLNDRVSKAHLGEDEIRQRIKSHLVPWAELKSSGPYPDAGHAAVIKADYESFLNARAALVAPKAAERAGAEKVGPRVSTSVADAAPLPATTTERAVQDELAHEEPVAGHPISSIEAEEATPGVRKAFDRAMQDVYVRAKQEAGYTATYFLEMLHRHGALETARRLLASSGVSDGFAALWERERLDLTVENVILEPRFESLFSDEECEIARERLREYGQDVE